MSTSRKCFFKTALANYAHSILLSLRMTGKNQLRYSLSARDGDIKMEFLTHFDEGTLKRY
jgi:hypothetical protein